MEAAPPVPLAELLPGAPLPVSEASRLLAEWLRRHPTAAVVLRRPPPRRVAFWPDRPGRYFWVGIEEWAFSEPAARRKAAKAVNRFLRNQCMRHCSSVRVVLEPPVGRGPYKVSVSAYVRIDN